MNFDIYLHIATEAADITMTREDLRTVPNLILLSRKAISNIKQNLFLSFVYNMVAIPVAAYLLVLFLMLSSNVIPIFSLFLA
jgi:P-type E1-E2 ATPase